MLESGNIYAKATADRLETDTPREGRRIAVQAVDPTALPKRERRRPLRQSHSVRPSQSRYPVSLHHSNIPV